MLAELGKLENKIAAFSNGMRNIENLNLYNRLSVNLVEPHWEPVESGEAPLLGWVNMPGGEYIYLSIENKQASETAPAYQGGAIKYLFHRQKVYGVL